MHEATYNDFYHAVASMVEAFAEYLLDEPGDAIDATLEAGGPEALEALFDALIDAGLHAVLLYVLNSPALPDWIRELLERLLHGAGGLQSCALLMETQD